MLGHGSPLLWTGELDCCVGRLLNTMRLRQNGRHFPDDILKCIFLNDYVWISIKISLKFVPKGSFNNIPALLQIMAWHQPGNKPLYNQWWFDFWRIYVSLDLNELTHWGWDKMDTILQTKLSKAFLWMKFVILWFKFQSLSLQVQLTVSQHWFR